MFVIRNNFEAPQMLDGSFVELMGQEGQADYGRERLWKHNSQQSGAAGRNGSGSRLPSPRHPYPAAQGGRVPVAWRPGVTGSGNKRCSGAPVKGSSWQG